MNSNQTLAMSNRRDAHMQESSSCTESDVLTNSKIPPPSQKVILVASGMDDEMESHAINLAIEAISIFPGEKMKIAKYIANAFEANYASLWHCIVSDGHMRFYVRYDADNHIYFAIGQLSIFLFRLHRSKPRVVLTRLVTQRRMSDVFVKIDSPRDDVRVMSSGMQLHMQHYAIRITDDAINEFPNEKMIIAHRITTRFELKYGGNWHCVVSDASLGYEVRHDREDHMFFSVGHLTVLIFREMDLPPITTAIQQPPKRKISTSMQFPTRIISSGMNMESQQFAVNVAVKGILMKENKNESTHLAEFLVSHFDERFGPHWYCFTADRPLAFYTHYDPNNYIHLRVDLYTFLLFKVAPSQLSIHANVKSSRNEAVTPVDGNTIVVDLIERNSKRTQIMASDMPESMKERAQVLAAEAVKRFPDERMLCAHFIMTRFEAEFGPPCHCVISDTKIEYGFHECNHYYCYFLIDSLYIFLFQNDVSSD